MPSDASSELASVVMESGFLIDCEGRRSPTQHHTNNVTSHYTYIPQRSVNCTVKLQYIPSSSPVPQNIKGHNTDYYL